MLFKYMEIKVSIIIPVYDVASYIEECLHSVDVQTYQNIEVVIVDDCGTDNSLDLAIRFVESSARRKQYVIVRHDCNKGLSVARNTGILKATGNYLYFLDSDDWINSDCIEKMVRCVQVHPQAEIVYAGNTIFSMQGKHFPTFTSNSSEIKKSILTFAYWPIEAWNKLILKEFILSNDLFFRRGIVCEDLQWDFYVAKYLKAVCFLLEDTYHYRFNDNGIMRSQLQKQYDSFELIIIDCLKHLDRKCLFKQLEFILHITHVNYVKRYNRGHQFVLLRYVGTIIYLLKILLCRHEQEV